jgi:acyl transferase domain-containing protein/NAD(P)H-dependent flavin oxidoreductase YrpB (nitropropane dioxygenase family)
MSFPLASDTTSNSTIFDGLTSFDCLVSIPVVLDALGLSAATVQAGGVCILDWQFVRSTCQVEAATRNTIALITSTAVQDGGRFGFRISKDQYQIVSNILQEYIEDGEYWLIFYDWQINQDYYDLLNHANDGYHRILLEITNVTQLQCMDGLPNISGFVARGHESGGWSSADSAFILTQRLVQLSRLPTYIMGGIGVHTSAACKLIGAAGVVLDDQLWLMPESPLSFDVKRKLEGGNGQEALLVGEATGWGCRVFSRPGLAPVEQLKTLVEAALDIDQDSHERIASWRENADPLIGWDAVGATAWPMGQAIGLAAVLRDRYKTTGRLIQAILQVDESHIAAARLLKPLGEASPLAQSHGTRFPIVQGPMTRVSDSAAFANAVSEAGALPMLALALMKGEQVLGLLQEAKALIGERPWGIGILGFVPQSLRQVQLEAVMQVKPPFALIAGGRPDQAQHLEAQGIATYLHVPSPALLQLFLQQGAFRFVFEGRECGGHVGPLSSFILWESMIDTLLRETEHNAASNIHVLFAGGIHDAASAAMVAAMAAPLAARGVKVGVLMGSAYLVTEESVRHGAIVQEFQQVVLECHETVNLETGIGHASRCAVTPFAEEFAATRQQLKRQEQSADDIKNALERLTLGRLRIASKGLTRSDSGIVTVDVDIQHQEGMYMIGQVATLCDRITTLDKLHTDVSIQSTALLNTASSPTADTKARPTPADIAIIGIGTLLPNAQTRDDFWQNTINQVNCLKEIPQHRWDWRLFYDADQDAPDKIYSKWGGFIDDVLIDPLQFGIPPKSLKSIDPMQLLTLAAVQQALADAGYEDGQYDRLNTSVILGAGGGLGDLGQQYAVRTGIPLVVENPPADLWDRMPEWTEDSFPGLLFNVAAGRVANRLDLGGVNYTVDAACASSLAAVSLAVRELETGRSRIAIAGGIDTLQNPLSYMCFSKSRALSPQGKPRPFDEHADGITTSEGIAILVLKPLKDAQRDGDRIYAVIKAVEGSSDGKALGMTAPRPAGQQLAVERAYQRAGYSPATLGFYEAHGTGTAAGDRAELETVYTVLTKAQAEPNSCVLGSVKSLIGHTKATAGVAGLIKAALALHYRVRPGHAGVETPLQIIDDPKSPVCLLRESQPWLDSSHPRRASVSAFGFGGTNFHALLEAYEGSLSQPVGGDSWPQELIVLRAQDCSGLVSNVKELLAQLKAGAEPLLRDLAFTCAYHFERQLGAACVAIVASSLKELQSFLETVISRLESGSGDLNPQIQLNLDVPTDAPNIGFLFPGQGSQYPNMVRQTALYFPCMRAALETTDRRLGQKISQFIFPPGAYSEEQHRHQKQALLDTRIAQPAIGAVEMGFMGLMNQLGVMATAVCGHSYGEYAALHYAEVLTTEDFLKISALRGTIMATCCGEAVGGMAAVQATVSQLSPWLLPESPVVIANVNAPDQTVISGPLEPLQSLVDALNGADIPARLLPVAGAFHSPLVAPAQLDLADAISNLELASPKIPVYCNTNARPYPTEIIEVRDLLSKHLTKPVNFVDQIEAMYRDGIRVFLEVGPKNILTDLTRKILASSPATITSLDNRGKGLTGCLTALGELAMAGVPIQLSELHRGRSVRLLNLLRLAEETRPVPPSPTSWLVNGGSSRAQSDLIGCTGKKPYLTVNSAAGPPSAKAPTAVGTGPNMPLQPTIKVSLSPVTRTLLPAMTSQPVTNGHISKEHDGFNGHVKGQSNHNGWDSTSTHQVELNDHSSDTWLSMFESYQATMRHFLSVQERVVGQFLGGDLAPPPALSEPSITQSLPPVEYQSIRTSQGRSNLESPPLAELRPHIQVTPRPTPSPLVIPTQEIVQHQIAVPPTSATATSASTLAASTPTDQVIFDREGLTKQLLNLVSERTGYPTEMLGLDQDMEAELGIDSIKRVEILGALQKILPAAWVKLMLQQMESLTQVKTLSSLVDQVLSFG